MKGILKMRRIALWGLIGLGLFAILGVATLASRAPHLQYEDVRPEIQPIEPEISRTIEISISMIRSSAAPRAGDVRAFTPNMFMK